MLPLMPPKMLRRSDFLSAAPASTLRFLLCRLRTLPVSVAVPAPDTLRALSDLADTGDGATSSFSAVLSSERPKNCRRRLFSFGAASLCASQQRHAHTSAKHLPR
jgi:hypothetical protein